MSGGNSSTKQPARLYLRILLVTQPGNELFNKIYTYVQYIKRMRQNVCCNLFGFIVFTRIVRQG